MTTTLLWLRQDLRLSDNPALCYAAERGAVVPVFIWDDAKPWTPGGASRWWLHHSLVSLDASLKARGNRLVTLTGDPRLLIDWLVEQTGASAVFWNRRYDGAGREIDAEIKAALKARGEYLD